MNPDGYAWTSEDGAWSPIRRNAHDIDLNRQQLKTNFCPTKLKKKLKYQRSREFPTWRDAGKTREELIEGRETEVAALFPLILFIWICICFYICIYICLCHTQPKVAALIPFILDHPWVLSINFHAGAVVANYPWDSESAQPWITSNRFRWQRHVWNQIFKKMFPESTRRDRSGNTPRTTKSLSALLLFMQRSIRLWARLGARSLIKSYLSLVQNRQRCIQDTTKFEDGITNGFDWWVSESEHPHCRPGSLLREACKTSTMSSPTAWSWPSSWAAIKNLQLEDFRWFAMKSIESN